MYVSILLVRVLLSELQRRDIPEQRLLEGTSIDAAALANMRATIDVGEWASLLVRALEITGDPALGLALGEHWSPSMLQLVGQLISSCRTLRDALAAFDHYRPLIGNHSKWTLHEEGDRAYLFLDPEATHPIASRVGIEAVMTLAYRIGRTLFRTGDESRDEVWVKHEAPAYAAQYARVFPCKVRFKQPRNAFVFPREHLDIAQPHGDQTVHDVLRSNADVLLRERESESVAERVRAILRYEPDVAHVDVRRIANQLGMNVRALRRRLGAEQSPLSNLLDEARLRVARSELRKPGASIKEVAHGLGFSEASAFHRAFKRWSGQTPAQYVKQAIDRPSASLDAAPRA